MNQCNIPPPSGIRGFLLHRRLKIPSSIRVNCFSRCTKRLIAVAMPTMTQATVSTSVDVPGTAIHTQGSNWKPIKTVSPSQDVSSTPSEKKRTSKYRHVAAYHSALRTSPLSTDSPVNPSFIGFRNLMVIVLSMSSALTLINRADVYTVVMNLRLVVENFMKVSSDECRLGSSV